MAESASEQSARLTALLHDTEAALESIAADQADAVIDPDSGSPVVLRQALLESHRRYHRLVTRIAAVVFELAPDGTTLFVNQALTELTGFRTDQVLGQNWWEMLAGGATGACVQELRTALTRGDVTEFELPLRTKTGDELTLEINSANEYGLDGRLQRIVCLGTDVTQRRRAVESLRESEQRLRTILETLPVGVGYTDCNGRIIEANTAGHRIWGGVKYIGPDELGEYRGWWHENGRQIEAHEWALARAITKGETSLGEVIDIEAFDGTRKIILNSVVPLCEGDRVTGAILVNEDVTERIRGEEERHRLLKTLSERVKELSLVQNVARLLQRKELGTDDLLRAIVSEIPQGWQHPDLAAARIALDGAEFRTAGFARPSHSQRAEFVTADGKLGEIEVVYLAPCPAVSEEGPFLPEERGLLETLAEMLRLHFSARHAEEAVRRSEEQYRSLIETARDAVFHISPEGNFTSLNAAFEEITGWPRSEWLGRPFLELLHPDDVPQVLPHFERSVEGRQAPMLEFRVKTRSGGYLITECTSTPQFCGGRVAGVLGIGRDITERRRLEENLRQAQKMEAVGRLAGGVAHDFNNMLTIINGYCELVLSELPEESPLRELVGPIHEAGLRSSQLTRQLLTFSRRQAMQPQPLDLARLVSNASGMLRRIIGEDVELVTATDEPLGLVEADPGQIEQILLNLAVNARDAMPHGGRLTVETRNVDGEPCDGSSESTVMPGPLVMLSFTDSGCGMAPETAAHVFEPFFTTKDRGKGTGLGLATVYGIVQQSGGRVDVESEPGQGTCFRVYLPRLGDVDAPQAAAPRNSSSRRGAETILLVEDEPVVRLLARRVLRDRGYTVLEAGNGCEALNVFEAHGDRIELVVTDVIMPQMGGRELVERLRILRSDVKVLYISGYTGDALVQQGRLEPGTNLLFKPFTPDALAERVRAVLDGDLQASVL